MRHYEVVLLVKPDTAENITNFVTKLREKIASKGGVIHRFEDWGGRTTAYLINNLSKVNYFLLNIECSIEVLSEFKDDFYYDEFVLRNLIIRKNEAITEKSKIAIQMEEEKK